MQVSDNPINDIIPFVDKNSPITPEIEEAANKALSHISERRNAISKSKEHRVRKNQKIKDLQIAEKKIINYLQSKPKSDAVQEQKPDEDVLRNKGVRGEGELQGVGKGNKESEKTPQESKTEEVKTELENPKESVDKSKSIVKGQKESKLPIGKVAYARYNPYSLYKRLHPNETIEDYNEVRGSDVEIPTSELPRLSKEYDRQKRPLHERIKDLKIKHDKNTLQSNPFGIVPATWNAFVDTVSLLVKGGMALRDAIQSAIKKHNITASNGQIDAAYKMLNGDEDVNTGEVVKGSTEEENKSIDSLSSKLRAEGADASDYYSIGISPFAEQRIQKYWLLNKIINKLRNPKRVKKALDEMRTDLEFRISNLLPEGSYETRAQNGVWGGIENSFEVRVSKNVPLEDVLFLSAKLGQEFDQDAVHLRDFGYKSTDSDILGVEKEDGSAVVPYAVIRFNRSITPEEFNLVLHDVGLEGGTLDADGEVALIYNGEIFDKKSAEKARKSTERFNLAVRKLKTYDSRGIQTIREEGGGRSQETTALYTLNRTAKAGDRKAYNWVLRELYPKISRDTRERIERERDHKEWARKSLSERVRKAVIAVSTVSPKIKTELSRDFERLRRVGTLFGRMVTTDDSSRVRTAYTKLAKAIRQAEATLARKNKRPQNKT